MTDNKKLGWMFWGLIASAGVNILLIGIFVGVIVRGPPMPRMHDMIGHMTQSMSPADAKIIAEAFQGVSDPHDQPPEQDKTHRRIRELLMAPTVDVAALNEAADEEAAKRQQFDVAVRTAFVTAAPKLSLEGRVQLIRNFEHH